MLDLVLRGVSARLIRDVSLTFPSSTHTAVTGPPACGASTLLQLIAGELKPERGEILIGSRVVNRLPLKRRPLLFVHALDVPRRWSVGHALVAAVARRSLDREDRHHEYTLALERWQLTALADRKVSTLSSSEETRVLLARIELSRPAILVADRMLERANASERYALADEIYRLLRVMGTTVISTPSTTDELAFADRVAILDRGTLIQQGSPETVFNTPLDVAAAASTGEANIIPVFIKNRTVVSVIGEWDLSDPPFQGSGVALIRADAFSIASAGEESDLIYGVEEAAFRNGTWFTSGILSGSIVLHVAFPRTVELHKGKLLPLRYDSRQIRLVKKEIAQPAGIPTDVIPPLHESR